MERGNSVSEFSIVAVAPTKANSISPGILAKLQAARGDSTGLCVELVGKAGRPLNSQENPLSARKAKYTTHCETLLNSVKAENKPPLVKFSLKGDENALEVRVRKLAYKLFKSDIKLVRNVLETAGFTHSDKEDWNLLWTGTIPSPQFYEKLTCFQKINHFPSTLKITRKDKLCKSLGKLRGVHGQEDFGFFPTTFVLPDEFAEFYSCFQKEPKRLWIVKPIDKSQGKGIFLLDTMGEVPIEELCVISQYVHNPLLINGLKFDLRLYVLIVSYEPLRIYIYEEGLVRFASEPYKQNNKTNRFIHLTNYSVNKKHRSFVQNADHRVDDTGNKWSLSALCKLMESLGVDTGLLWKRIYDLVIKTVVSCEPAALQAIYKLKLTDNCFDLLGFDVLLDEELKPWLLEVNLCPSLATDSPLDFHIKSNLVVDLLNLIGVRAYDSEIDPQRFKGRKAPRSNKRVAVSTHLTRKQSPCQVKGGENTGKFRDSLRATLEEEQRKGRFIRIYPAPGSSYYDQFFQAPRQQNTFIYNSLYQETTEVLPRQLYATIKPTTCLETKNNEKSFIETTSKLPSLVSKQSNYIVDSVNKRKQLKNPIQTREKLLITGDDILIEYIQRLIESLKQLKESECKLTWKKSLNNFINNSVWSTKLHPQFSIIEKLTIRLSELKQQHRKQTGTLIPSRQKEAQKQSLISKFDIPKLEEFLSVSSRNCNGLIHCFIDDNKDGLLSQITRIFKTRYNWSTEPELNRYDAEHSPVSRKKQRSNHSIIIS